MITGLVVLAVGAMLLWTPKTSTTISAIRGEIDSAGLVQIYSSDRPLDIDVVLDTERGNVTVDGHSRALPPPRVDLKVGDRVRVWFSFATPGGTLVMQDPSGRVVIAGRGGALQSATTTTVAYNSGILIPEDADAVLTVRGRYVLRLHAPAWQPGKGEIRIERDRAPRRVRPYQEPAGLVVAGLWLISGVVLLVDGLGSSGRRADRRDGLLLLCAGFSPVFALWSSWRAFYWYQDAPAVVVAASLAATFVGARTLSHSRSRAHGTRTQRTGRTIFAVLGVIAATAAILLTLGWSDRFRAIAASGESGSDYMFDAAHAALQTSAFFSAAVLLALTGWLFGPAAPAVEGVDSAPSEIPDPGATQRATRRVR